MYGPLCWQRHDHDPGGYNQFMWYIIIMEDRGRYRNWTLLSGEKKDTMTAISAMKENYGTRGIVTRFTVRFRKEDGHPRRWNIKSDENLTTIQRQLNFARGYVAHCTTKHTEIRCLAIQQWIRKKRLSLSRVDTKINTADLFTKHLNGLRTQSLAKKLGRRILGGTTWYKW